MTGTGSGAAMGRYSVVSTTLAKPAARSPSGTSRAWVETANGPVRNGSGGAGLAGSVGDVPVVELFVAVDEPVVAEVVPEDESPVLVRATAVSSP